MYIINVTQIRYDMVANDNFVAKSLNYDWSIPLIQYADVQMEDFVTRVSKIVTILETRLQNFYS